MLWIVRLKSRGPRRSPCCTWFAIIIIIITNSNVLLEAGLAAGQAARATEQRKHDDNDAKCKELGWICVPMVVEAYGAWGTEAMESFSLLASRLATSSNRAKAEVLAALYGRLNLNLVRANATAILSSPCMTIGCIHLSYYNCIIVYIHCNSYIKIHGYTNLNNNSKLNTHEGEYGDISAEWHLHSASLT